MSKLPLEEIQSLRSRIYHGEQELISTLTPEQFFALLSHDYDTGFAAGKASTQKEILCMLAADGMLVKRPILAGEDFVLVGFREAEWAARLG